MSPNRRIAKKLAWPSNWIESQFANKSHEQADEWFSCIRVAAVKLIQLVSPVDITAEAPHVALSDTHPKAGHAQEHEEPDLTSLRET